MENTVNCPAGQFKGIFEENCLNFFGIPYASYQKRWENSELLQKEIQFNATSKGRSAPQTRIDNDSLSGPDFFLDNSLEKQ